ncbi:MAG: hypothetical protein C4525_03245 [Desulfarculus sp.]|nr:MAG: hypothetical protein C4525_03245 [Desulfarculus sp.]
MKRSLIIVAVLALTLALLGGCATNKMNVPLRDGDGKMIAGTDGKPIMQTYDLSDSAVFHQVQNELAKLRKPVAEVVFPQGGTVPPGMTITVWGPNGLPQIAQYREPWLEAFKAGSGIFGMGWLGYVLGWGPNTQRGGGNTYNVSNSGANSSVVNAPSAGAITPSVSVPTTTTTTPAP